MFRFIAFIILSISVAVLFACGGGGAKVNPNPNPPAGDGDSADETDNGFWTGPISIDEAKSRMPSSGYVPNEVLVKSPLDKESLDEVVSKYGYQVDYKNGNYAKVHVPNGDLAAAISKLSREQTIYTTTVNAVIKMPARPIEYDPSSRKVMRMPFDPFAGDVSRMPGWGSDPTNSSNDTYFLLLGSGRYWDFASISGAHDITFGFGSTIAVIDGGAVIDGDDVEILPTDLLPELRDWNGVEWVAPRLSLSSAKVLGDGSFTTIVDNPKAVSNIVDDTIYLSNADDILTLASSNIDLSINLPIWAPGNGPPADPGRAFPAGIPGVAPAANYMMIATGTLEVGPPSDWTFTAAEIAASITYAVDNGADVIILGMWSPAGDFSPGDVTIMQDAVNYARANDVVIVAPVGEDQRAPTETDPGPFPYFDEGDAGADPPIPPHFTFKDNFSASEFLPAALTGVISVGASGASSPNFEIAAPYHEMYNVIAGYSAADANIYATGLGVTSMYLRLNTENALPWYWLQSGNHIAAGYVGGTLALMYSALRSADPEMTDIDTQAAVILLNGDEGNTNQLLQAAGKVAIANNGGYDLIYPALNLSANFPINPNAITTNAPFSVEPVLIDGQAPYEVRVEWGDGTSTPTTGFTTWTSGMIIEKPEGYSSPTTLANPIVMRIRARDNRGTEIVGSFLLLVTNPLSAAPIVMEEPGGDPIQPPSPGSPIPLTINTNYVFNAKPFNLLGLGGESYSWDFGDGSAPATEQNPVHKYLGTGNFPVNLSIDDGIRPVFTIQISVSVS